MFTMMNHARLGVGIEGIGIAERAYQHALEYARTRVQGRAIGQRSGDRVTIIHHPDVKRMLLTMKSQTEAMRAIALTACASLDSAAASRSRDQSETRLVDLLDPIFPRLVHLSRVEVASRPMQVPWHGLREETGAVQYLRERDHAIYEGTTGSG